jgi:hypothetical protein
LIFAVLSLKELDLIRFPIEDSKLNYLAAFWQWIALLEADDYDSAVNALYWSKPTTWTGAALKDRITTFFGGDDPWFVVIPNDRLIAVINDSATFSPGWFMAQIPLTTQPVDPKDDEIPLMGLASSFFVRENDGQYVMEHEIFHL